MKPNFALTLSFEGIGLLHRAFPGWHLVGEVTLDSADLAGDLALLRDKALRLDASGLRSKLVIPNDQIKYLQFDAEERDAEDIADAVRRHLEDATPYSWGDLACDWAISAGQVFVAAVARETLAEAEAFATEHKFNPLSFVAMPETRDFVGEPWFGLTQAAADQTDGEEAVERDTAAIRIIGAAHLPEPDQRDADEPLPTPAPELPPAGKPAPEPDTADASVMDLATPEDASASEAIVETAPENMPAYRDPAPQADMPEVPADTSDEAPAPSGAPTAVAFSSIRAQRDDVPPAAPRLSGATREKTTSADTPRPETRRAEPPLSATPPAPGQSGDVTGTPPGALPEEAAAQIGAGVRPVEDDRLATVPEAAVPPEAAQPPQDDEAAPSFFTRRSIRLKRGGTSRDGKRAARAQPLTREDEKQRMTVFGAREPARVGGKPRFLGVILTAVLLLFLVGVAAWASIFMDDGLARFIRDTPESRIAATPDAEIVDPALIEEGPEPGPQQDTVVASLAQPDTGIGTDARPDPAPAELSADEARARYAATGIWQLAPEAPTAPGPITLDDFYLTSIDPKVIEQDAVALPDGAALLGDARPDTPADPPAADTVFRLDPRGFVRATPEGAVTPNGVRVFAGQPPVVPPRLPERAPADDATPEVGAAEAAAPEVATLRPKARPGDLNEQNERSTLGGRTRNELAGLRPQLRPKSVQELAEEAAAAETEAAAAEAPDPGDPESIEEAVAAAVQTPDPFAGATAQAVSASLKPQTRPRNFDRIVRRSQEQAQEQDAVAAKRVPSSQRAQPTAPTATTVARAATENNALKLRRVNLIGVYGTPSNRRALVRLANGRYKKVKVGDRLDGGRVNAIGDSELRYVKGGRNVTLTMPRG